MGSQMAGSKYIFLFFELLSEYCSAWIINFERKFAELRLSQKNHHWNKYEELRPLYSLTVGKASFIVHLTTGILGIGDIGEEISRVLTVGFRSKVIGYCSNPAKKKSTATRLVSGPEGLTEIVSSSDYLINILPHTNETVGLLNGLCFTSLSLTL